MRTKSTFAVIVGVLALSATTGLVQAQERVCKQECIGAVCKERCVERDDTVGRRERERRDTIIEERREPRPGIELRTPAPLPDVDVKIR